MGLALVSGTISMLRERTDVSVQNETIRTEVSSHFRIGNRPANVAGTFNLSVGDVVTAAGRDSAEFQVLALRNDTTNMLYSVAVAPLWAIAFMLLVPVAGVAVMLQGPSEAFVGGMFLLMGMCTFPGGLYLMWKRSVIRSAFRMVQQPARA
jgi:hypothetical protein